MARKKSITEDIKPSWLNPVRAAQAVCRNNKGFAVVHLTVLVEKNDPVAWAEPELIKIHPARLAEYTMSPMILGAILAAIDTEVDSNDPGT